MIADANALRIDQVPREMVHREGAIDHLSSAIDPTSLTGTATNVCLFGPSGVGKTTLAKFVLERLEREVLDVRWGMVNCISEATAAAVTHKLVSDAGLGRDLRREGTPRDVALDRLRECDEHVVAVLDEVDALADPRLLATLADMPGLSLVSICIDGRHLFESADERVRSRLRSAESISLDAYTHAELVDILEYRVEHGLDGDRVDGAALAVMADRAAGNARVAIALLRKSVQAVVEGDADRVTTGVVEDIEGVAREDVRERHVRSLGTHQRLLYDIIREAGEIAAADLHAEYERRVADPRTKRTRRRYLQKLVRYDLVVAEGPTKSRAYQHNI